MAPWRYVPCAVVAANSISFEESDILAPTQLSWRSPDERPAAKTTDGFVANTFFSPSLSEKLNVELRVNLTLQIAELGREKSRGAVATAIDLTHVLTVCLGDAWRVAALAAASAAGNKDEFSGWATILLDIVLAEQWIGNFFPSKSIVPSQQHLMTGTGLDPPWPIFGALAILFQAQAPAGPPQIETIKLTACQDHAVISAGVRLLTALRRSSALAREGRSFNSIPVSLPSGFLASAIAAGCTQPTALHSAAYAILADKQARGRFANGEALLRRSQQSLNRLLDGPKLDTVHRANRVAALATSLAGIELMEQLDRMQCQSVAVVAGPTGRGGDPLLLAVHPFHDLASDLARLDRRLPCSSAAVGEAVMQAVVEARASSEYLASPSHGRRGCTDVIRVVEVGAGIGGCILWAVQQLQAAVSVGCPRVEALAVEPEPEAAELLRLSAQLNGVEANIRVISGRAAEEASVALDLEVQGDIALLFLSNVSKQELDVLQGARRLFSQFRVGSVTLHFHDRTDFPFACDALSVFEWLVWHGRFVTVRTLDPNDPWRILGTVGEVDDAVSQAEGLFVPLEILSSSRQEATAQQRHGATAEAWSAFPHTDQARTFFADIRRGCLSYSAGQRPNSWAEIDGAKLRSNLRAVAKFVAAADSVRKSGRSRPRRLGVVVGSHGFGHDPFLVGQVLANAGADAIFALEAETALRLRASSQVSLALPIILLRPVLERTLFCSLIEARIAVAVVSVGWLISAESWPRCRRGAKNHVAMLHISVDSGLGREGMPPMEARRAARIILRQGPRWRIAGIYTKYCCASDRNAMAVSINIFGNVVASVSMLRTLHGSKSGCGAPLLIHIGGGLVPEIGSSTATVVGLPSTWLLRIGRAAFGNPVRWFPGTQPALVWKSRLSVVRTLPAGSRLGYCASGENCRPDRGLQNDTRVAVVPVGSAEFARRSVQLASSGARLPLLHAAASTIVVELSGSSSTARMGDEVLLCAPCRLDEIPPVVPRMLVHDPALETLHHCPHRWS
eukprot:TRINITY_DN55249_c0_g1_i1.p1 TRINITY_DN55249_c0_g1~~TRINITY_DN55249_c0_g1_i1.p1  ORF type:complete len:1045 (-),score=104.95 TRINITY_DN55249_c0_g1_i1:119-3178(-)